MKNLFLIDGASGTGKSDLLSYVDSYSTKVAIVRKATTREMRDYEKDEHFLDLEFISEDDFDNRQFRYEYKYTGKRYGFQRTDIETAFKRTTNVFIIVRNQEIIKQIKEDFGFINVVSVYIHTDSTMVRTRLEQQKMSEDQIKFRLARLNLAYEDYVRHSSIYQEVLINNSSQVDYHAMIDSMLEKYRERPDVKDNLVFILMSFNRQNPNLEDYAEAMKRAVTDHDPSFHCVNLDDLTGSFKISHEAKRHILQCRLAIVDLTENKPNVFYELGFAHASGKEVIITAHEDNPILFYPSEYKIVRYVSASDLYKKLRKELEGQLSTR